MVYGYILLTIRLAMQGVSGGSRQGRTVLVQLRGTVDLETGARYTIERYQSERVSDGDTWRHEKITLNPVNPEFDPIVISGADEGELTVVAELVDVPPRTFAR